MKPPKYWKLTTSKPYFIVLVSKTLKATCRITKLKTGFWSVLIYGKYMPITKRMYNVSWLKARKFARGTMNSMTKQYDSDIKGFKY